MEDVYEALLTEEVISELIRMSREWEEKNNTYGYYANSEDDIEGRRVFIAERDGRIVGYLFGMTEKEEKGSSIIKAGTSYFEIEELYVIPEMRSQGLGKKLFSFAEDAVSDEAEYVILSMAAKNWKPLLHFYMDEVGMEFWNARLFRRIRQPET